MVGISIVVGHIWMKLEFDQQQPIQKGSDFWTGQIGFLPYGPIFGHHIPKVQEVPRMETVKETVDPLQTEIIKRFKLKARKIADFEGFLHHINIFSQVKIPNRSYFNYRRINFRFRTKNQLLKIILLAWILIKTTFWMKPCAHQEQKSNKNEIFGRPRRLQNDLRPKSFFV